MSWLTSVYCQPIKDTVKKICPNRLLYEGGLKSFRPNNDTRHFF